MGRDVPVALAACLLAAGCAYKEPVPAQTVPGLDPTASIQAMDWLTFQRVAVRSHEARWEADRHLRIQVEIENLKRREVAIQVQTVFGDPDGQVNSDATSWQVLVLPSRSSTLYDVVSLQPDPGSWTLRLKTP